MRGSTRKRGPTWTAYWDIYDPATGERQAEVQGGLPYAAGRPSGTLPAPS